MAVASSFYVVAVLLVCLALLGRAAGAMPPGVRPEDYAAAQALAGITDPDYEEPQTVIEELVEANPGPHILVLHNLLTPEECDDLVKTALDSSMLQQSRAYHENGTTTEDTQRTSFGLVFSGPQTPASIPRIRARVAKLTGYPVENLEPSQFVYYKPGTFFKPHWDFVGGGPGDRRREAEGGQRVLSMFIYLNELPPEETGGATGFPKLGLRVRPSKGSAVSWYNVLPGTVDLDHRTRHEGEATVVSSKYGMNVWIRERAYAPFMGEAQPDHHDHEEVEVSHGGDQAHRAPKADSKSQRGGSSHRSGGLPPDQPPKGRFNTFQFD